MRLKRANLLIGGTIIICLIGFALLSLVWTPGNPAKLQILNKLKPPLIGGLFGSDQLGRDVASMMMIGAWNSLSIAASAVALGGAFGSMLGMTVAARGGFAEAVIMRANDVIFAIPPILSAMMLGAILGTGRFTAILAIAVFMVPVFCRVTVGAARQIWARDYILAARAAGKGKFRITRDHVLPNIANQIIVQATIQLGLAMLTEAGLSFLGLGLAPPAPSWGKMLADSQTYLSQAPWLALFPGLAIALAVFGFNLLGDGLRDLLDPREAGR
ncbi:ABC transporter permease [Rhizobium paknamense]|uniref:Peptide/nickel transport system permease protein n=1 Tax=Rhizobium paknamense TaxID=1206817 RepID=A0ABU0IG43_9HYPH|nr:ABC transporter permease [Rhizobium paknamense]MDQ0457231.1 peptide/nickel transport system permease protein [Rhizobium paknamense]